MTDAQTDPFTLRKSRAAAWFRSLRDDIVAAFEGLEQAQGSASRFQATPTTRSDGGGGIMSVLRVVAMTARGVPGMEADGRFWASGISLVAHMANPHCPAVHMNTRMFWTPGAAWFGGGADLNPCIEYPEDTAHFHGQMRAACDAHDPDYYARFKAWADTYFYIPHRGCARGVGGIFYDDLATGDWEADFAFTQAVGRAFLPAFLPLTLRRLPVPWSEADREVQLIHRGLYAEYNLVYDRGTKFGLESGHDPAAVLMSLPPVAKWI
jgi:coproporphyrinogen III oxidase